MMAERYELRPFLNQPVVILGRLSKEARINHYRNACIRAIELRPFVSDQAVQDLDAVCVHHGWIQLTGLEDQLGGLVPMICASAMVSRYTRNSGSSDLGFSPFASVCLDHMVRQAAMKKTDDLARQFVSDQLRQIEQGRPFFCFHADPAMVMMQLQCWLMDDKDPPSAEARLAEVQSMIGVRPGGQPGFARTKRKSFPRISGFG